LKNLGALYGRQGKNDETQVLEKVTLRTKKEVLLKFFKTKFSNETLF
jgi:hypothetical protein